MPGKQKKDSHKEPLTDFNDDPLFLKRVADSNPAIVYVIDLNKVEFVYINKMVEELLGHDETYVFAQGKNIFREMIHPENYNGWIEHLRSIASLEDKEMHELDLQLRVNGEGYKWFRLCDKVFSRNDAGLPVQMIGVAQNIHKSKTSTLEMERELRSKAEERLRDDAHFIGQVMDTTPNIISIMDLNTYQVIYSNRSLASELGYIQADITGMKNPVLDLVHEEDLNRVLEHLRKLKTVTLDDAVTEIEYRVKNANGGFSWICESDAVFKRDSRKIPVEKIGISRDITDKKLQEDQIITSRDILGEAENITGIGSWEYDIETGDFRWSEGMYRLFGIPNSMKVTPEIYLTYTDEADKSMVERVVNGIEEFTAFEEVIMLRLPGQEPDKKYIRIKAVPMKDKQGRPVRMIGVDLDITSEVMASREIRELNKTLLKRNDELTTLNDELRTFNTITSKDYKETLQTLYTNLEYIVSKDSRNLGDTSRANIRKAQGAIQKMKLLTDDINSYLQLYDQTVNRKMIDPNEILSGLQQSMRGKLEQSSATLELTKLPGLLADPILFSKLMHYLIDNAIKFRKMAIPPVINIKYSRADEMDSVSQAMKDTPYTIISVTDNGIGFPEAESERIFELFYRLQDNSKHKGSGVGLAVCRKIMSLHGGFITAESEHATGATFNCYFPMV